ncbi:kinase-like domain-containing protein [Glomus cerebriforme]|uniref:Kinase-like domain-containing protein n=1 Tax=Glomus cerebriforme TaxID=658196 RepID=A0A397SR19_9GLOM|nr:kinase-like domain-containing protein [Glomus cerebriforme]
MQMDSCKECGIENYTNLDNSLFQWCEVCDPKKLQAKFGEWTSGNKLIDEFIQQTQLHTNLYDTYLEWIEPSELSNVNHLEDGGFGSVYTATWSKGIRIYLKDKNCSHSILHNQVRTGPCTVALKTLNRLQTNIADIINEVKANFTCQHALFGISMVIGITKHPYTHEYAFVMWYYDKGNLRSTFKAEKGSIKWSNCVDSLYQIAIGLRSIHEKGWIHRDLHSGNVLTGDPTISALPDTHIGFVTISDFGLCKHINHGENEEDGKYGVIPYMAPELFDKDQQHTQASDIYALGIIMWELSAREPAFQNRGHDINLICDICNGLRPSIPHCTPSCWTELMQKCWSEDPSRRPTASEIIITIRDWYGAQGLKDNIKQQFEDAQIYREKQLTQMHERDPGAIYTSRLIPHVTKEMVLSRRLGDVTK